jgi:hypothetical protein
MSRHCAVSAGAARTGSRAEPGVAVAGRIFDPQRYPTAVRVGSAAGAVHGSTYDPLHAFEFGLRRVLDGIGVFIDRCGMYDR